MDLSKATSIDDCSKTYSGHEFEVIFGVLDLQHLVLVVNSGQMTLVANVIVCANHALPPVSFDILSILEGLNQRQREYDNTF